MIELKKDILFVGAQHPDRKMFDELIPLPHGTSYNSYLIKGSVKNALIDTVDPEKTDILLKEISNFRIDYVIPNHAEQDHSGSIPQVLAAHPEAKVVANIQCKNMLIDLLAIPESKFMVVNDQERLSLGNKTLRFILTPWVHWPETMVTYLEEDKILFSCDFFGSHMSFSRLFASENVDVYENAKVYYAEIMMPFRKKIVGNIKKVKELEIDMIAPSHGPVYDDPNFIIGAYDDWTSDDVKNEVVLAYVSMHGSTKKLADYLKDALIKQKIKVHYFNIAEVSLSDLASSIVDAATIVIGTPCLIVNPHPLAAHIAFIANALKPKTRFISVIGSYGWAPTMVDRLKAMVPNLDAALIGPVTCKGVPKQEDYLALDRLAQEIYMRHQEIGKP